MMHATETTAPSDFSVHRNAAGQLVLVIRGDGEHVGVVPVRSFPIAAPHEGVSLVGSDGRELVWITDLGALPHGMRQLLDAELAAREFMPVIARLKAVSTFSTPSTWEVTTDKGDTRFVLKGEEDIRRLGNGRLLITSEHGVQFVVADMRTLDKTSRKLLERFL